ncbi:MULTISPECIES: formyltransferase family protein [unclassified Sphingobacterium]|uniref:formyltransferase family protein n=1 Tax=unclassified Sphingobacterium TaxID=2609468 RepID=UPI0010512BFB|nr:MULTISPECIES: formyltransferase family protein [unclassified Sphingobacterium]MCS3554735.1 methionyl-tRNA formyltransferase [Sphingobacterium sp. JUb21]TCR07722.1 methionyl-tRNA formyltransferase [Sphingobacterium sp. JUb20]
MKVFLVIDETNFYQPNFINQLLQNREFEFVGCALVVSVPKKNNIERYLIQNMKFLTFAEILKLGFKKIKYWTYDKIGFRKKNGFFSVRKALEFHNTPFFTVKGDINEKSYLDKIRKVLPDIILSSNSLYFKEEIINIPKFCINRHSSLLPSYGGLWPVFQALRNNEKFIGVSVHMMTKGIDEGRVLSQIKIEVLSTDTVDLLYQKCFNHSAEVCIRAMRGLCLNRYENIEKAPQSYFSFPLNKHWCEFRKKGKRFI